MRTCLHRSRANARGMTLIEVLVAMAIISMMVATVWSSFSSTMRSSENARESQERYQIVRNAMNRLDSELSMAYLSFNRPPDEPRHFTLFEGRDDGGVDSVTFSAFAHLRIRRDANESDQALIQYFVAPDPDDSSRTHLYRRESRRLTGDLPEKLADYFPAYVVMEDVVGFNLRYWDSTIQDWTEEWSTMRNDAQPDRLPQRVAIDVTVLEAMGNDEAEEVHYHAQAVLPLQEKIDLGRN